MMLSENIIFKFQAKIFEIDFKQKKKHTKWSQCCERDRFKAKYILPPPSFGLTRVKVAMKTSSVRASFKKALNVVEKSFLPPSRTVGTKAK